MTNINTKKYESIINKVLIDDRERSRIEYAMEQYAPFNPIVEHLPVGDYIFSNGKVDVVFEYKTGPDFLNSINSPHLHDQVYHMITNFDYTFVIVECEDLRQELDSLYYSSGVSMSLNQINGAIAEYNTVSTVLFAQTEYQAFDLMMRMSGKIIMNKPFRYKYGKKTENTALNYLSSKKGLDNKAVDIVETLDLHTLNDLLNLTVDDLTTVEGIGKKTAERILQEVQ